MFLHVFHTSFTRLSHVFHVFHRFMCISALIAPPAPLHYLVQHAFIVIASLIWFSTYFGTSFTSFIRFCLYLQTRNVKFHVFQMFCTSLTRLAHIFFLVFHTLMCSSALLGRTPPVLPPPWTKYTCSRLSFIYLSILRHSYIATAGTNIGYRLVRKKSPLTPERKVEVIARI